MATLFTMPKLGLNMVEGRIISWLVNEGSQVTAGQPLVEIETDKATNEVEAPVSGIIGKIFHKEGDDVLCNGVLAVILEEGEVIPNELPSIISEDATPISCLKTTQVVDQSDAMNISDKQQEKRIYISPSARKLAIELGVDITNITPNGNQIKREDVERAHKLKHKSNKIMSGELTAGSKKPYSGIRKLTGDLMALSVHTTARVALNLEVNAEKLISKRKSLFQSGNNLSYDIIIAKAVADALSEHLYMNSRLIEDEIWEFTQINIGIAVDSDRGLVVPVIKDADKKDLVELHNEFSRLVEETVNGSITLEDLENSTFTITNLGAHEIEFFVPVINFPECAILAIGAIKLKPIVLDGIVAVRNMVSLTLVFDHRIVDGLGAAKFLQRIKQLLEAE